MTSVPAKATRVYDISGDTLSSGCDLVDYPATVNHGGFFLYKGSIINCGGVGDAMRTFCSKFDNGINQWVKVRGLIF